MLDNGLPEDILLPKSHLKLHFSDWLLSVVRSSLFLSVRLFGEVADVSQKHVFFFFRKVIIKQTRFFPQTALTINKTDKFLNV